MSPLPRCYRVSSTRYVPIYRGFPADYRGYTAVISPLPLSDSDDTFLPILLGCIPYTAHVSNAEVRSKTGQPPTTTLIEQR